MARCEIKGAAVADTIAAIKGRVGEERFRSLLALTKPETQATLATAPIVSGWYPLDVFTDLLEVDMRETCAGNERELVQRSEAVIDRQLRGIYRLFVRLGSPEFVLKRIAGVHETYFRGVGIEPSVVGAHHAVLEYVGFEPQHRLMEYVILGFYKKALEISGAKSIHTRFTTRISDATGTAELHIKWAAEGAAAIASG